MYGGRRRTFDELVNDVVDVIDAVFLQTVPLRASLQREREQVAVALWTNQTHEAGTKIEGSH